MADKRGPKLGDAASLCVLCVWGKRRGADAPAPRDGGTAETLPPPHPPTAPSLPPSPPPPSWNFTPSPGWTADEAATLKLCLLALGVGRWSQIQACGLLPGKMVQQLNGQTQRLLGQQSLAAYTGLQVSGRGEERRGGGGGTVRAV